VSSSMSLSLYEQTEEQKNLRQAQRNQSNVVEM
jgi:hypothetical protein